MTSSSTKDFKIVPIALPTIRPTAKSMALPLPMKSRKSLSMEVINASPRETYCDGRKGLYNAARALPKALR
jgi:hypothetical protein